MKAPWLVVTWLTVVWSQEQASPTSAVSLAPVTSPPTTTVTTTAPPSTSPIPTIVPTAVPTTATPSTVPTAMPVVPTTTPVTAASPTAFPLTAPVNATESPTATPNLCSGVEPGDIQIILSNSDDPDQVAFFTIDQIPQGVGELFMTDRPWNGTLFLDNGEGTLKYTLPPESAGLDGRLCNGLCAGTLFSFGFPVDEGLWEPMEDGEFDLSIGGDSILIYCMNADGEPHFITAFTYANGGFAEPGQDEDTYSFDRTSLPDDFVEYGFVAVPFLQNYRYVGPSSNPRKNESLIEYARAENYEGSNEQRTTMKELEGDTSGATLRMAGWVLQVITLIGLAIV